MILRCLLKPNVLGGFYSKLINHKLRVIVPNTNLYYKNNPLDQVEDPGEQFKWMEEELNGAIYRGEQVNKDSGKFTFSKSGFHL